ncbi:hypothetical protein D3Z53_04715 [Lachnospiraceae bacterium]|nr:hypothetical protein [uncultured Schaedlerella sp.]EOS36458.1 hypothetical protein C808_04029 [Lachnospiraceae bacterium M18-1]MCI9155286.1 hypothetical protein [Ruminococcus sp.]NBI57386.1 hypothetical protein [Lachnospiraceae bacterium]
MAEEQRKQEIREALGAGARALTSLREAQEKLESARKWGVVDLFGGGFVTDMIKHSRMDDAINCMETAKRDLQRFQKELGDVEVPMDLRIEISTFLSFADFFFDGLVADYLVQKRIVQAREQVDEAIGYVESLMAELKRIV